MIQVDVTEDQVGRIDLVVRTLVDLPRSKLKGLFDHGCVSLNQLTCASPGTRVNPGDKIVVTYDPHQGYPSRKRDWSDRTFSIVHEDEHLIVVNKAAGVLTVPTTKNEQNTLIERVSFFLSRKKKNHEALLVHRLDRGMSGLIVFAKTPDAANQLRTQFTAGKPGRVIFAIVNGVMEHDSGTYDTFLDTHNNLSRFSTSIDEQGQHAVTKFKVLKRMKYATAVELELLTARRHQARVHLFEAGHPVLGDDRYVKKGENQDRWTRKRLAMHAVSLTFIHPANNDQVTYTSELPVPLKKFIRGG